MLGKQDLYNYRVFLKLYKSRSYRVNILLNVFSNILTAASDRIGRDGNIQADNELGWTFLNVASSLLSSTSKKADPNDEVQRSPFKGFNSILLQLENNSMMVGRFSPMMR